MLKGAMPMMSWFDDRRIDLVACEVAVLNRQIVEVDINGEPRQAPSEGLISLRIIAFVYDT